MTERLEIGAINQYALVIDDKDKKREKLSHILQTIGWEVKEAETNVQALELLSNEEVQFSIVVTDAYRRPERHGESGFVGLDLVRTVNQKFPELPVVIISRDPPETLKRMAPNLKVSGLFRTDFSDRELMEIFRKIIEGETFPNPWALELKQAKLIKIELIQTKLKGLVEEYTLLSEKITTLRKTYIVETDASVRFKLEKQIEQFEGNRDELETDIVKLGNEISNLSSY